MTAFTGFPSEHLDFFEAVARDTSWDTVAPLAALHERAVRLPMQKLVGELETEFGRAKIYRLHRSRRYWIEQWAYVEVVDTIAFGVSLSLSGLCVEAGWLRSSPDQVARYRAAADEQLERLVSGLEGAGYELLGDRLKRAPSRLLAYRSLVAARSLGSGRWLESRQPLEAVRTEWQRLRPLVDWLSEHVGPRRSDPLQHARRAYALPRDEPVSQSSRSPRPFRRG